MLGTSKHAIADHDEFVKRLQTTLRDSGGMKFVPVGAQSKPALIPARSPGGIPVTPLDLREFQGVVTYDPSEFLITARAGTPIAEIQKALSGHGQFLPFDPLFASQDATLGGTIASGISGPDRLLYGGVRDFIMEVAMIDGLGNFVRGGGKVVKNAAGFDTPKMMVGSYGRLGVIVEATLKVFPAPQAWATLIFDNSCLDEALRLSQKILSKSFPIAGVDVNPNSQLIVRIAAPASSLSGTVERIESLVARTSQLFLDQEHARLRDSLNQWLEWELHDGLALVRVVLSPAELDRLHRLLAEFALRDYIVCAAGSTAWIKLPASQMVQFSSGLRQLSLSGIVVRGSTDQTQLVDQAQLVDQGWLGDLGWLAMAARIQQAVDPNGRFAAWESSTSPRRD